MFREKKATIWVLVFICGVLGGFLLVVRLDFFSPTKAEYELPATIEAQKLENGFVEVAKKVGPAVVSISTERTEKAGFGRQYRSYGDSDFDRFFEDFFREFFGDAPEREYKQRGLGSGFIIDRQGYILTNQHVIADADKITVTLPDGRKFKAEIKGSDTRSDLAIIKIEADNLPLARLGNSDDVQIGQWAIAIGNPYGYIVGSAEPTVTVGIVSALSRSLPQTYDQRSYIDLIQTDAAINPGNSGGPLVNIMGEVIGINVAIFTPSGGNIGIGFAIPINSARDVAESLIAGKKVQYGWLGVSIQDLDEELSKHFGVLDQKGALIVKVLPGGPAEKAGFREGDVLRKFAGEQIKDMRSLLRLASRAEIGKEVEVEIIRDKRLIRSKVKVGERPEDISQAYGDSEEITHAWRGMQVSNITADLASKYRITETQGVVVTSVEPRSPAYEAGLIPGDVISSMNRQRIKNLDDYEKIIKGIKGATTVLTDRGFTVLKDK